MENKTTEAIPGLATDAVLVQSQEMPKNSEICKGKHVNYKSQIIFFGSNCDFKFVFLILF